MTTRARRRERNAARTVSRNWRGRTSATKRRCGIDRRLQQGGAGECLPNDRFVDVRRQRLLFEYSLPYDQTTMSPMDLPVACSLNESELRERRRTILAAVRTEAIQTVSLPNGYCYHFARTAGILAKLADVVNLEHQCCAFLTFRIIVEAGDAPIRLEVTGPPEAKEVIAEFFGA
jgi:hypothetical protein